MENQLKDAVDSETCDKIYARGEGVYCVMLKAGERTIFVNERKPVYKTVERVDPDTGDVGSYLVYDYEEQRTPKKQFLYRKSYICFDGKDYAPLPKSLRFLEATAVDLTGE